jgi:hypothetical protein
MELNNGGLLIYLLIYILQHLTGLETKALHVQIMLTIDLD